MRCIYEMYLLYMHALVLYIGHMEPHVPLTVTTTVTVIRSVTSAAVERIANT
jgi:hypothetical protein